MLLSTYRTPKTYNFLVSRCGQKSLLAKDLISWLKDIQDQSTNQSNIGIINCDVCEKPHPEGILFDCTTGEICASIIGETSDLE